MSKATRGLKGMCAQMVAGVAVLIAILTGYLIVLFL